MYVAALPTLTTTTTLDTTSPTGTKQSVAMVATLCHPPRMGVGTPSATKRPRRPLTDSLCMDELRIIVQHADPQSLLVLCNVGGPLAMLSLASLTVPQRNMVAFLNSPRSNPSYFDSMPSEIVGKVFGLLAKR